MQFCSACRVRAASPGAGHRRVGGLHAVRMRLGTSERMPRRHLGRSCSETLSRHESRITTSKYGVEGSCRVRSSVSQSMRERQRSALCISWCSKNLGCPDSSQSCAEPPDPCVRKGRPSAKSNRNELRGEVIGSGDEKTFKCGASGRSSIIKKPVLWSSSIADCGNVLVGDGKAALELATGISQVS